MIAKDKILTVGIAGMAAVCWSRLSTSQHHLPSHANAALLLLSLPIPVFPIILSTTSLAVSNISDYHLMSHEQTGLISTAILRLMDGDLG